MTISRARTAYMFVLLGGLVVPQVWAQIEQIRSGYRPLATSPTRVSYSWDMFSTSVERCDVRWDPPLRVDGKLVSGMNDRSPPIEFGTVYDDRESYRGFAFDACDRFEGHGATITMRCALPNGTVEETRERCP